MNKKTGILFNLKKTIQTIVEEDIVAYAHQLTFSLLIASFPFIIFLFTLIGYTSLDPQKIIEAAAMYLPQDIFQPISSVVLDVVGRQHTALLSFSILVTLWSASAGFRTLMLGLDKAFIIEERRPIWAQFLVALIGVVVFSVFILLAMLALVFGTSILDAIVGYLGIADFTSSFRTLITFVLPVVIVFAIFVLVYRFLPSRSIPWSRALRAAAFASLSWTLFTLGFRIYVGLFMDYSKFYGVLGSIVGLLFWLLATSLIILLGAVIAKQWTTKKEVQATPEPYHERTTPPCGFSD